MRQANYGYGATSCVDVPSPEKVDQFVRESQEQAQKRETNELFAEYLVRLETIAKRNAEAKTRDPAEFENNINTKDSVIQGNHKALESLVGKMLEVMLSAKHKDFIPDLHWFMQESEKLRKCIVDLLQEKRELTPDEQKIFESAFAKKLCFDALIGVMQPRVGF